MERIYSVVTFADMEKERIKATHFIEQYIDNYLSFRTGGINEIKYLPTALRYSRQFNCKTIAIFKIKAKDNA